MKIVDMKVTIRILLALSVLCSLTTSVPAQEKTITVAAAADLSAALKEIAADFQKQKGIEVKLSFGASGALTQQIENGGPFDIFFSADMGYPQELISKGYASSDTLYRYAVGKLILWAPDNSPLNFERNGLNTLLDPLVQKIAIANPERAPYGRAAMAALKHAGLYDKVSSRLVTAENISQAAQFVDSGNAQVGFVALAHAMAPDMKGKGKYWLVPAEDYPTIDQGVIVMSHSSHKEESKQFIDFMKAKEASAILQRYGFTLPQ
ncbi:MAG TPA: molybdate ABC transporter substrate-binding protein [Candidatus Sulfotelmatobacter sp.]